MNTRSASVRSLRMAPQARAKPARGVPAVRKDEFAATPGLLVPQLPGEFRPARIADGAGQPAVAQHPTYVQVFDDEPSWILTSALDA